MDSERKNIDYVAIDHQLECSWRFIVAGKAEQTTDITRDALQIIENVYQIGCEWVSPFEVRYGIAAIDEDVPINDFLEGVVEKSLTQHEVRSEPELTRVELVAAIEATQSNLNVFPILTSVDFRGVSSKLQLSGGAKYINRDSHLAKTWAHGTILDEGPYWDPITFNIKVAPPWRTPENTRCAYELTLDTNTDIWFEENEYARSNRKRLTKLLSDFCKRFDVRELNVDSNRFEEAELQALVQCDD